MAGVPQPPPRHHEEPVRPGEGTGRKFRFASALALAFCVVSRDAAGCFLLVHPLCPPQEGRAVYWRQPAQSSGWARTSAGAFASRLSSTGYLDIKPLLVRQDNHPTLQLLLTFVLVFVCLLKGLFRVRTNTLLRLADRKSTSALDPCAATQRT